LLLFIFIVTIKVVIVNSKSSLYFILSIDFYLCNIILVKNKKTNNMEYLGAFRNRKVDSKRRFVLPVEWLEGDEFMVQLQSIMLIGYGIPNAYIYLYTKENWLEKFKALKTTAEKLDFSKRSLSVKLESNNRLALPKGINWKSVDVVGMGDCIVLVSSSY